MDHVTSGNAVTLAKKTLARQYRREPTPKEAEVWEWLRGRRMMNLKWRRQQVIDGFIVDFYCAQHRLALEIDGEVHSSDGAAGYDLERDNVLARKGIQTLRITNNECTKENLTHLLQQTLSS